MWKEKTVKAGNVFPSLLALMQLKSFRKFMAGLHVGAGENKSYLP
jgi:hypothetical protein